jgi:Holliday junction resolvase RusA-like endonuclease
VLANGCGLFNGGSSTGSHQEGQGGVHGDGTGAVHQTRKGGYESPINDHRRPLAGNVVGTKSQESWPCVLRKQQLQSRVTPSADRLGSMQHVVELHKSVGPDGRGSQITVIHFGEGFRAAGAECSDVDDYRSPRALPKQKNLWKRGKGGRTYIDSETKGLIDALTIQARAQWKHEPVTHPDIGVQFFARDRRRDRDNMLTTILDCLRDAGVIVNDNIAQANGTLILLPAVIDQNERTMIEVTA